MWVGILENLSNWFAPRAVNEVSRSEKVGSLSVALYTERAVQKQAERSQTEK